MKLELTQKLQQQQILAPQMILSMDILLLAATELEQRIEKEFSENPALEIVENLASEKDRQKKPSEATPPPQDGDSFARLHGMQGQFTDESFSRQRQRSGAGDSDARYEMLQNIEGRRGGLREHLLEQLGLAISDGELRELAEEIIQNLDNRGYLASSAEEVFSSVQHRHSHDAFDHALSLVRSLDPPGVAAENLTQCLLLQLERDGNHYDLETKIISRHLEDLRDNKLPKIAKELSASLDDVKDAIEIIQGLDPLPGAHYESVKTIYVKPDVVVERIEERLVVRVEDGYLPQLCISDTCRDLLKSKKGDASVAGFLRKKIDSAQWLIQALQQRQRTLYDISVAMVDYQRDFMERGVEHLRAMRMQTIADLVGIHISTVSRAIKGKYMQTPWGLFDMRYFFTGGVESEDGTIESRRNIYRLISDLIENEDKSRPLSDTDITEELRQHGLHIARRTVSKYREQERIPASRLRRRY